MKRVEIVTSGTSHWYSVQKMKAFNRQESIQMNFGDRISYIVYVFVFDILEAVFSLLGAIFGGLAVLFGFGINPSERW